MRRLLLFYSIILRKMRLGIALILTLLINIAASARPASVEGDSVVPQEAYEWYPQYVTFLPKNHIDSVLQYSGTDIVPVKFELYKIDVVATPQLDSIISLIKKVNSDERVKLAYVWVGGSASPDGRLSVNVDLAQKRGKALTEYIRTHANVPDAQLRFENLGEDWYTITNSIKASQSQYKDAVLKVIDEESDADRRELKLKRLQGGKPWAWLKSEILPKFRNARMVIVCSAEDIKVDPIEKIEPMPERKPAPDTIPDVAPSVVELPEQPVDTVVPQPEPAPEHKWFIAAKTNLLWLVGTVANLGVEVQFADKWTVDIPVYYSPYDLATDRKIRVLATQPEVRYWLGDYAGQGHFVGVHGHIMGFNVAINDHGRYQDPERALWGFGLGYGYAMNFGKTKRWGMEFNLGLGFANYEYDKYYNLPNGQKCDWGKGWYYGLTRAGITLTYKWWVPRKYKKAKKEITD